LKHDNEEAPLSPEMTNETEPDDLMLNLNKISYREGTMGRLPSTYSFSELDQVPSFGSLDDDESGKEKTPTTTPTPTPVTTLRTSTERKKHNATGAPEYERKVVLAQSVVRKAQAKKRYKQIRKSPSPFDFILFIDSFVCFIYFVFMFIYIFLTVVMQVNVHQLPVRFS
jgi:hypothetical protein